jgi:hypothetical protein
MRSGGRAVLVADRRDELWSMRGILGAKKFDFSEKSNF